MNESTRAPDFAEAIVCFRRLEVDGANPFVTSPYRRDYLWWPARSQARALCTPVGTSPHAPEEVPAWECSCGFYGYVDFEGAAEAFMASRSNRNWTEFVVVCQAWGKIVVHDSVLRAEYMEIVAVHNGPYRQTLKPRIKAYARDAGLPYLGRKALLEFAQNLGWRESLLAS